MSQSIHGHEVMRMMLEMGGPMSRENLKQAIVERFGEEARFWLAAFQGYRRSPLGFRLLPPPRS